MGNKAQISIGLFLAYFIFLLWGCYNLPGNSGPDESATLDAAKFYQQEKRLARFPQDLERIKLSPYGSTRLTRPPFPFAFAAITDSMFHTKANPYFGARISTAILLALTVVVILHIVLATGAGLKTGLAATLISTSIPQYLFYGTYLNDDSGAFLATALITLSLVHLLKKPLLDGKSLAAIAFCCGFVFINKITAWIILPAYAITIILYLLSKDRWRQVPKPIHWIRAIGVFTVSGGFWLIYNIIVYGWNDPFQQKITSVLGEQYSTISDIGNRGYLGQYNKSYSQLMSDSDFINASYTALIGNLGRLEIRLDPITYWWFGLVLIFAITVFAKYLATNWFTKNGSQFYRLLTLFSGLWLISQVFMYLYFNVHVDIQIQGKYLLPTVAVIAIFLALGLTEIQPKIKVSARLWLAGLIAVNTTVLAQSLTQRIIPFYNPPAYTVYLHAPIAVDFSDSGQIAHLSRMEFTDDSRGATFISTEIDPLIIFTPSICDKVRGNFEMSVDFIASGSDRITIYVDEGSGFQTRRSYVYKYDEGKHHAHIPVAVNNCQHIRIDLMDRVGTKLRNVRATITPFHAQRQLN